MNRFFLAALEYEYLCESFDRSLDGYSTKHNDHIPFDRSKMTKNARQVYDHIRKKYCLEFGGWKETRRYMDDFQRLSYTELCEVYNEHTELMEAV